MFDDSAHVKIATYIWKTAAGIVFAPLGVALGLEELSSSIIDEEQRDLLRA